MRILPLLNTPPRSALALAVTVATLPLALGATEARGPQAMDGTATPPAPALSQQDLQFFESKIRPILVDHCYKCHSAKSEKVKGGLRVDTREALLQGGSSGPAISPGDVEGSLLIRAVRQVDDDYAMPPDETLPADAVAALEQWVRMGAPDPRSEAVGTIDAAGPALYGRTIDIAKGKEFWSFRPPVRHDAPKVDNASWAFNDIDRFVLAGLEGHGLQPVDDASRPAWLRRVTFDLTGLPPTPVELESFEKDRSASAYEKVVDRLLASPAFGERWGRHWLDVARYAESSGKENNILYPHAWRYRDYVIAAFNADKPYDDFLKEQLAGDLLPAKGADDRAENLVATAYLALGPKSQNAQNRVQFAFDVADEQIDAVSQGMLGVTVACARCHDHKFDPIPQKDYYALAGIFLSSSTEFGTLQGPGNRRTSSLIRLPEAAEVPDGPTMPPERRALIDQGQRRVAEEAKKAEAEAKAGGGKPDTQKLFRARQQQAQAEVVASILERFDADGKPTKENRLTMGMLESQRMVDAPLLQRGEVDKAGQRVERGFVQVLCPGEPPSIGRDESGRFQLAEWIASPANPLTARVWVNRVWLHLFGKGLVPTPDNFGMSGQPPTHPELLDTLAVRFGTEMEWSTKRLIREIVLSHAYRLSSTYDKTSAEVDPDDTWLWRMPKRRLEAEAIRDAMLTAAGTLQAAPPVGSPVNFAEGGMRGADTPLLRGLLEDNRPVRSVYLPIVRDQLPEVLDVFDFAEPAFVIGDREETNVPTQALYLMNNSEVQAHADAFARRLLADAGPRKASDSDRITSAFLVALGRKPTAQEILATREFLGDFRKAYEAEAKSGPAKSASSEGDRRPGQRVRNRIRERMGQPAGKQAGPADAEHAAWSAFCQSLFQTSEFRTLD